MMRHAKGNPHVFTLTKVFLLQGALQWVVSMPLQLGQRYDVHRRGCSRSAGSA